MVVEALVTEEFYRAFHNLQPQKQKIVKEKIGFLARDPRHPSLGRHQLQRIKRTIWECKIDDGMRLLHEIKNNILYLWDLGGHAVVDNAHLRNFADNTPFKPWKLESEASTSPVAETANLVYKQDSFLEPQEETLCATLNYFAYFRTAHLRILGVPENLVQNVQDALSLADALKTPGLPEQIRTLLEELSTSPRLESVMFDSSRLLFRSTLDRLEGYFEGKIKKLMLNLLPEQQQYIEMERNPLLLLKGTAGSGKTTIGIYRSIHLASQGRNVLMLAFGSTLSSVTRSLIEELIGPIPENLQVRTLHSLMKELLHDRKIRLNIPESEKDIRKHLQEALSQVRTRNKATVLQQDENFFQEEIRRVIKGLGLKSIEQYKDVRRYGRKTALRPMQREAVWEVYKVFQRRLDQAKIHEWSDVALLTLHTLQEQPLTDTYDDIIVDEAQDLTPVDLLVVQQLVVPLRRATFRLSSIMILGDAAQTLYSRGFSWEQAGIQARGRTAILRKNHRNTRQIAEAAAHLLKQNTLMRASNEYVNPEWTQRQGPPPILLWATNWFDQIALVRNRILDLVGSQAFRLSDVAVLCRTNNFCELCQQELNKSGLRAVLRKDGDFNILEEQIKVLTIHSAKGLEFPVVFLLGLTEGELPSIDRLHDLEEEEEKQLEIEKQRTICYVGMTRAAEELYLVTVEGRESRFVQELEGKVFLYQ